MEKKKDLTSIVDTPNIKSNNYTVCGQFTGENEQTAGYSSDSMIETVWWSWLKWNTRPVSLHQYEVD